MGLAARAIGLGLPPDVLLQLLRVLVDGMERLADAENLYFHRRAWTRAAQQDFVRHLTEETRTLPSSPGASPRAVVFMLVFDEPREAVLCGVALLGWCADEPLFPPVHIGAHAGEVLFRDGDFVGAVVNLAARVASVTEPMQFLVTDDVLTGLNLDTTVTVVSQETRSLKGLHEPVRLHAVSAHTAATSTRELDPVCGMAIRAESERETRVWRNTSYAFCSPACGDAFLAQPGRYVSASPPTRAEAARLQRRD